MTAMSKLNATGLAKERARFNALSPAEAQRIITQMGDKEIALRSCWYCNGAHNYLKEADYPIWCMGCGGLYVGGYPAPVLGMRSLGEEVTDETMEKFEKYIEEE